MATTPYAQEIQTFDFKENPVRALERDGQPWFVAADVCRVLELANPRQVVSSLHEDEKATVQNMDGRAGHGAQSFNVINESGLYALIFKSRKPQAQAFRKWVTSEVLPTLRKTGHYQLPKPAWAPLDYERFPVCKDFFEIFHCLREQQVEPNESCSAALRMIIMNLKLRNKSKIGVKTEQLNSTYENEVESLEKLISLAAPNIDGSEPLSFTFSILSIIADQAGLFREVIRFERDELTAASKSSFGLLLSKHDGDLLIINGLKYRFAVTGAGRGRLYSVTPAI